MVAEPYDGLDRDRLARAPALGRRSTGGPRTSSRSASGPPLVFVHGLSGSWQNWLEQHARVHATTTACIAVDLPGFGESPMPREKITISGYGRWLDALLDELDIEARRGRRQLDGRLHRRRDGDQVPARASSGSCSSPPPGCRSSTSATTRILRALEVTENVAQFVTAHFLAQSDALVRRPRGRTALMWFVAAHPERARPARSSPSRSSGAGKPGFVPALDALTDYPIRDRLSDIELPDAHRAGARRTCSSRSRTPRVRRADPRLAAVDLRGHGHVADARAARAVQRATCARSSPSRPTRRARAARAADAVALARWRQAADSGATPAWRGAAGLVTAPSLRAARRARRTWPGRRWRRGSAAAS